MAEGVRKRTATAPAREVGSGEGERENGTSVKSPPRISEDSTLEGGSFWLTRIVFTRSLGLVYCE